MKKVGFCTMPNIFPEVDLMLEEIRDRYDAMRGILPKAAYLKRSFEDRYLEILKGKTDLVFFLKGEQEFLERFEQEAEIIKGRKAAYRERNQDGFAEGVLQELQSNISGYPALESLDANCIKEVSRLYGAAHEFIVKYWDDLCSYIRGINTDLGVAIDRQERSLSDVYSMIASRPPKAVEFYNEMVVKRSGNSAERIRAAQDAIQFAGIWLNHLMELINLSFKNSEKDPPAKITAASEDLAKIIKSFRLNAFAKRKI